MEIWGNNLSHAESEEVFRLSVTRWDRQAPLETVWLPQINLYHRPGWDGQFENVTKDGKILAAMRFLIVFTPDYVLATLVLL